MSDAGKIIERGEGVLGLELGSTRIKAVLIGPDFKPLASGSHAWENRYENGVWTYHMEDVWEGIRSAFAGLKADVQEKYGVGLKKLRAMGVSAMMHGYLAFDEGGTLLSPFRTWRNTMTAPAAEELTAAFSFNVPQRWSIAHLYQAILNGEEHVKDVRFLTTLAGYVHWKLTGERVLGIGDASGMFPIDSTSLDYNAGMLGKFDALVAGKGYPWRIRALLPKVLRAGEAAGTMTAEGAALLDPTLELEPGTPLCPPEGDAGTGMAATNSVAVRTGNVSAGTSIFAMVVLEKPLSKVYPELDIVTTPAGADVAMVHCNNCTSDLNAWVEVLSGFVRAAGLECSTGMIFETLFRQALEGEADCGGLVNYCLLSGEPVLGLEEGRPMFLRTPDARMSFPNFARAQLDSTMAALRLGMDLLEREQVKIDAMTGHGGFFKTPVVGARLMAAALNTPVSVMETAGEGGPWGMALLAAYGMDARPGESLEDYLAQRVFATGKVSTEAPRREDAEGFKRYMARYRAALPAQRAAGEYLK